jgi:site-specific recombinase XerD
MAKRRIPEFLLPFEQELLLEQFLPGCEVSEPTRGRPADPMVKLRDLCLVRLMLNAGLRCSEAINLKVKDLEPDSGRLRVLGKGDKERIVWLGKVDVKLIRAYLEARPGSQAPRSPIFLNLKEGRVSSRYVRKMVAEAAAAAGIEGKRVHPHILRHSFATDLLRATKNLRLVKEALGDEDLATTRIYTHIVNEELEEAMKNFRNWKVKLS